MPNELISSLSALGIALAPALLKFAEAPADAAVDVDEEARVLCIEKDDTPVHPRYQSRAAEARLDAGAVVQILSKRKTWRHVAYVVDSSAELGWVVADKLAPCEEENGPREPIERRTDLDSSEVEDSPHVMLGVPADADSSDDHLVNHGIYVLSYSDKRR